MNKQQKQKRFFEVSSGQIFLAFLIGVIALTAAYEIGTYMGKKRLIEEEREIMKGNIPQGTIATRNSEEASSENKIPDNTTQPGQTSPTAFKQPHKLLSPPPQVDNSSKIVPQSTVSPPDDTVVEQPAVKPPEEKPDAKPKNVSYTIQVGVFSSPLNAEKLFNLLNSYEYDSWMRSETSGDSSRYYVYVGNFKTKDEADQFGNRLKQRMTYITGYTVKELAEN